MTTATVLVNKKTLASRIFGDCNRYRLDVFVTRFNTVEFFLLDVDAGKAGTPAVIGQADTLTQCLSVLPDKGAEFMAIRPVRANQIAINLDKHPVRIVKIDSDSALVECLGTRQQWRAPRENLVLA